MVSSRNFNRQEVLAVLKLAIASSESAKISADEFCLCTGLFKIGSGFHSKSFSSNIFWLQLSFIQRLGMSAAGLQSAPIRHFDKFSRHYH